MSFDFKIEIKKSGLTPKKFSEQMRRYQLEVAPKLEEISYSMSSYIRRYINSHRKRRKIRNKRSLSKAFNVGEIRVKGNIITIGVGDINYLDAEFPYWRVVDVGGHVPPSMYGYFGNHQSPKEGVDGEAFHRRSPGEENAVFFMKPKNPIRPMNYISATISWSNGKWNKSWNNYFSRALNKI